GYSAGALVHSFGSWNYLLLRGNAETLDELAAHLNQTLENKPEPARALHEIAQAYLDFALTHRNRSRLIFEHKLGPQEPLPEWHTPRIPPLFALPQRLLGQLKPGLTGKQLQTATRVLWGGVHGITVLCVDEKVFAEPDIQGSDLIDSLINNSLQSWTASQA